MGYRIVNLESIPEFAINLSGHDISREYFDYLGKWRINMKPEGYGVAHRIGLKEDVRIKGSRSKYLVIFHFMVPIAGAEMPVPWQYLQRLTEEVNNLSVDTAELASLSFGKVACVRSGVPGYMKKELEDILLQMAKPSQQ